MPAILNSIFSVEHTPKREKEGCLPLPPGGRSNSNSRLAVRVPGTPMPALIHFHVFGIGIGVLGFWGEDHACFDPRFIEICAREYYRGAWILGGRSCVL